MPRPTRLRYRTLLARQLHAWRACGISDITVVTGYRADMIVPHEFACCRNHRYDRTNMVSSLFCAEAAMIEGEGTC